jgi:beta-glucanase (GH16 family)
LVWSDEFTENSPPNADKWNYDIGYGPDGDGWGNQEWQEYTNSSDNVDVENGKLVITARCDSGACGKRDGTITSARIHTQNKFSIKYGRIKARIKPPKGAGIWPAFWMLGSNFDSDGWPRCGEIDILEIAPLFHDDKTALFTLHWWDDDTDAHVYEGGEISFDYSLTDDYHIFEVDWNENRIIGKIDDQIYYTKSIDPDTMEEFLNDFFIILNVAVGGSLAGVPDTTTQWTQSMYVDWVRVYKKVPSSATDTTTAGIFSESHTDPMIEHEQLVDSQWWGGNRVVPDTINTDVTPLDGDYVLAVDFVNAGAGWGGSVFEFARVDISAYTTLIFSIDTSAMAGFDDLEIEIEDTTGGKTNVLLASYTPTVSGNWYTYEIPFSDFSGIDFSDFSYWFLEPERCYRHPYFWNTLFG